MTRRARDPYTADLLDWQPPEPVAKFKADQVRAASLDARLCKASPQANPTTVQYPGVTHRGQLRHCLWLLLRANRFRRRVVGWGTEMEGLPLLYGDPVALSHDMPAWGQAAEAVAWDAGTRTLTLSEKMVFTPDAAHYIAIRKRNGTMAGPFAAIDGGDRKLIVDDGVLPPIDTGGDRERTYIQFGPGEAYAKRLKVISIQPRDEWTAELLAVDDDPRMYDPVPEDDGTPPGGSTDPLDIHITSNTGAVNMRSLASANGYTGNPVQAVTITIDPGVETGPIIRGTWPKDVKPTFVNRGTVSGVHGAPGMPGGDALSSLSGPLTVDNTDGILRGGGGGGANGGAGGKGGDAQFSYEISEGNPITVTADGGAPGAPGAGGDGDESGSPGSPGAPGGVLTGGGYTGTAGNGGAGGAGGDGGDWGQPGNPGTPGSPGAPGIVEGPSPSATPGAAGGAPGPFGAAGKAVKGNANITWIGTGTRLGPIA